MATVAGGPCVCLASRPSAVGLRPLAHCPTVTLPWPNCDHASAWKSRFGTGVAAKLPLATSARASGVCGSRYGCAGPCDFMLRNGVSVAGKQGSRCVSAPFPRLRFRRLGSVNVASGVVLDCKFFAAAPQYFPPPTYFCSGVEGLAECKSMKFKCLRHRRCSAPTAWLCEYPRFRKGSCVVGLAAAEGYASSGRGSFRAFEHFHEASKFGYCDVVEDNISLVTLYFVDFRISSGLASLRHRASGSLMKRLRVGRDNSSSFFRRAPKLVRVSPSRPVEIGVQAAESGQRNVSSEGVGIVELQEVSVEDAQVMLDEKLVGDLMGDGQSPKDTAIMSSQPDGVDNRRDIAKAAKTATIAAEISTNELVESNEGARLSRALLPDGYQAAQTTCLSSETGDVAKPTDEGFQVDRIRRKLATAQDADAVLVLISEVAEGDGRVLSNRECSDLILAALGENNVDLAYAILNAMRSSILIRRLDRDEDRLAGERSTRWRWPQADVTTYAALVRGLAASLRVSDALQTVADVRRRGVPSGDEVPFGKVIMCPTCKTALAVVQPQQGIQLVPCAKCRYQYELLSGDVVSCESEAISGDISIFERGLRVLQVMKQPPPSAVHSVVVRTPDGLARTHKLATASVDLPAQEGERITVALAAPASAARGRGPLRMSTRAPGWRPSEPMAITNHATGRVSELIPAPPKSGSGSSFDSSVLVPAAFLLASSDAATALIDPTLPRAIAVGAAAAVALGGAANAFVLPKLNQLPQKAVDAMAVRQQLLAQHETLQARLEDLTRAAAEEVRMLARMCQLQNKMEAVGESSYSARIARVKMARVGLDERLSARLELMDSYAKVASMIEIEVEMDVDVLAAEAAGAAASISEQIERLMEVESLQEEWKLQAEASDEVERLLRSSPPHY